MKKTLLTLIVAISPIACTTMPEPIPPQQLFEQFCTSASIVNGILPTIPNIPSNVMENIQIAQKLVDSACAQPILLPTTNLRAVLTVAIPVLKTALDLLPPATPNLAALKIGVGIGEVIIPQILSKVHPQ